MPDAGHPVLIDRSLADPDVHSIPLTTEEEGVALLAGADLGGARAVLLMQSSGVGNCINMLSLIKGGKFPLLTLVSMRGDFGENPGSTRWGRRSSRSRGHRRDDDAHRPAGDVPPTVSAAMTRVFKTGAGGRSAAHPEICIGAKTL